MVNQLKKVLCAFMAVLMTLGLCTVALARNGGFDDAEINSTTQAPTTASITDEVQFWDAFFSEIDILLGYVVDADVDAIIDALERSLKDMGVDSLLDLDTGKIAEWADAAAAALEPLGVPKSVTLRWIRGILDDLGIVSLYSYVPSESVWTGGNGIDIDKIESIYVTSRPNLAVYRYKQSFDKTGLVVTAEYADGSLKIISDTTQLIVSGYDSKQLGTQSLVVEYKGCKATFNVKVEYCWWQWILKILFLGWLWY